MSDRFTGPVEHKPGDVSLGFRIPRNNSETLPNVEPEIDLWVDDHASFMESVGRMRRVMLQAGRSGPGVRDRVDAHHAAAEIEFGFTRIGAIWSMSLTRRELLTYGTTLCRWTVVEHVNQTTEGRRLVRAR